MKIFCRTLLTLLIFFSFASFPQDRETQYRMLTKPEINSIVTLSLKDSAVIYEKNKLEKQGYRYVPAYSIGGIRTTDNAKFITLGFNKGISSLSSQIVYSTKV